MAVFEKRELYMQGPLAVVVEIHKDIHTVPASREFRDAAHRSDYLRRFDRYEFELVVLTARITWHGTPLIEEVEHGVEHGTVAEGVHMDAWEWRVAEYPDPNIVTEGSALNYVVAGALESLEFQGYDTPGLHAAITDAWAWADPNEWPARTPAS